MRVWCDTMKGVHQADDLFVCFGAKPKKGLSSRSRRAQCWAKERQSGCWKKELREAVGEGWCRRTVDNGQQWGRQSRWVGIPSSFLEISREIHASISLQMYRECSVMEPPFLHFELTQAHIVCSFSPAPSVVFLVAEKKCEIPRRTTRWITGQDRIVSKKLMYWGPRGVLSQWNVE